MPIKKPQITTILLWCIFALLLILGFSETRTIQRFPGASLRFNTPITGQTAHRARQHSAANPDTFWPTFWHQSTATLSVGERTARPNTITFSGNASQVWPAEFIAGSAPGSIDSSGIAVSEALAHRLWGSTDIVGMTAYIGEEQRTVRGVFSGTSELALISFHIEDTSQNWTAAELTGGPPHPTRNDAENFALTSGLGRPDYIIMGGAISLARFMSILPILIVIIYVLVVVARFIQKHYRMAGAPIIFAGLILFAILLPLLLNILPAWLIPTRWSDFSFWASLSSQANHALREFLSVNPTLRDVELKIHLLRQIVILIFSVCCSILVCANYSARQKKS